MNEELAHFAIDDTAIYITSDMYGISVPIHSTDFTSITSAKMNDTIVDELIVFENWNLRLWVNKNVFTGTYKSLLSSITFNGKNPIDATTQRTNTDCVIFNDDGVIISDISPNTLKSMIDSGFAIGYDLGCQVITT